MMSADGRVETAVQAIKLGAYHFVTKDGGRRGAALGARATPAITRT